VTGDDVVCEPVVTETTGPGVGTPVGSGDGNGVGAEVGCGVILSRMEPSSASISSIVVPS